eukprot:s823_g9.t1
MLDKVPLRDELVILGDFNARVGLADRALEAGGDGLSVTEMVGVHGLPERNENGVRLLDFCAARVQNSLRVASTFFQHREYGTWLHQSSKRWFQIDHVLCSRQTLGLVTDVKVMPGYSHNTDHRFLRLQLAVPPKAYLSKFYGSEKAQAREIQERVDAKDHNYQFAGYKELRRVPAVGRKTPGKLRDGKGNLICTRSGRILRWREYFEGLLNVPSGVKQIQMDKIEALVPEPGLDEVPRFEETIAAVGRLKAGRAAGPDGIEAELVSALDPINLRALHDLLHAFGLELKACRKSGRQRILFLFRRKAYDSVSRAGLWEAHDKYASWESLDLEELGYADDAALIAGIIITGRDWVEETVEALQFREPPDDVSKAWVIVLLFRATWSGYSAWTLLSSPTVRQVVAKRDGSYPEVGLRTGRFLPGPHQRSVLEDLGYSSEAVRGWFAGGKGSSGKSGGERRSGPQKRGAAARLAVVEGRDKKR